MSGFLEKVISKMLKSVSKHKAQQMCNMSEKSRKNIIKIFLSKN